MNPPDRTLRKGESYKPPKHDQKRVDQVKRIMEKRGKKEEPHEQP